MAVDSLRRRSSYSNKLSREDSTQRAAKIFFKYNQYSKLSFSLFQVRHLENVLFGPPGKDLFSSPTHRIGFGRRHHKYVNPSSSSPPPQEKEGELGQFFPLLLPHPHRGTNSPIVCIVFSNVKKFIAEYKLEEVLRNVL